MPRQCAIIVNPTSGSYSVKKLQRVIATLQSHNLAPELLLTQGPDDAARFARRLCTEQEAPLIIAAGGDGTVNEVLNGLVPGKGTLAVLPLGTSNVLAMELGIASLPEAVERIIRGETRPLPVGLLAKGGVQRYFSLMAGIGLDGAVVEGVRLCEKRIIGKGAYFLAALRLLVNWESGRLHVLAKEGEFDCHSVIVCNAAKYAGKFLLARQVDLFTPRFEVICVSGGSRSGAGGRGQQFYAGAAGDPWRQGDPAGWRLLRPCAGDHQRGAGVCPADRLTVNSCKEALRMNQDQEHLKMLSIFHYVVGGLTGLFACFALIYVAVGIGVLLGPACSSHPQGGVPANAFGWLFIIIGAMFFLGGWALAIAIIVAGRFLAARKRRIYCLVVAGIACMFMPFGTILGIFTIIVLMRPSVQELFEAVPSAGAPGQ